MRARAGAPRERSAAGEASRSPHVARRVKSSRATGSGQDAGVERLYGLPLGEFTAARDELAAELRAAGDSAGATRVKSLRKPSTAVWAINQVARRRPGRMDALLQAGERMREAQGAAGLREASEAHHELVWELLQQATNVLAEAGIRAPGDHLDGIRITLQSAPGATEHERELLRRGMLTRELEPADVGEVMRMMVGGERRKTLPVDATPSGRPATKRGERANAERRASERAEKATRGRGTPTRERAGKATRGRGKPSSERAEKATRGRGSRPAKPSSERAEKATGGRGTSRRVRPSSERAGQRKATRGRGTRRVKPRAAEQAAAERERRAAERAEQAAAERERRAAERAEQAAAERERRAAERAETRRRAAALRAYEKARRAAQQLAKQAERAEAAARKADQQAHEAEEAARAARERADAAERAAEEAEARAAEAEATRVTAEAAVDAPRARSRH